MWFGIYSEAGLEEGKTETRDAIAQSLYTHFTDPVACFYHLKRLAYYGCTVEALQADNRLE